MGARVEGGSDTAGALSLERRRGGGGAGVGSGVAWTLAHLLFVVGRGGGHDASAAARARRRGRPEEPRGRGRRASAKEERFLARRFPARRGRARGARARAAARRARALRRDPRGRGGVEDRGYGSHDVARACVRFVVPRASADDSRPRRRLDPTIEASSQLSEREKTRELFAFLGGDARARARDATRRETRCQTAIPTPRWTSRRTWATARPPGIGTRVAERVAERARISRSRRSFKPTTRTVLSADIHPSIPRVRPSVRPSQARHHVRHPLPRRRGDVIPVEHLHHRARVLRQEALHAPVRARARGLVRGRLRGDVHVRQRPRAVPRRPR